MIFMILRIGKGKGRFRAEDSEFSEEEGKKILGRVTPTAPVSALLEFAGEGGT